MQESVQCNPSPSKHDCTAGNKACSDMYLYLWSGSQEVKHVLHVDHVLLNGSVIGAKVVERGVQLLHQRYKQHCISYCQLPISNALHSNSNSTDISELNGLLGPRGVGEGLTGDLQATDGDCRSKQRRSTSCLVFAVIRQLSSATTHPIAMSNFVHFALSCMLQKFESFQITCSNQCRHCTKCKH